MRTDQFKSQLPFAVQEDVHRTRAREREREEERGSVGGMKNKKKSRILLFHIVRFAAVAGRAATLSLPILHWPDRTTFISVKRIYFACLSIQCALFSNKSVGNSRQHTNNAPKQCAGARIHSTRIMMRCRSARHRSASVLYQLQ